MIYIIWAICGACCSVLALLAIRLTFRDPITAGTVIGFLFGVLLPPVAFLWGIGWAVIWAFEPDQRYTAVKWPDWYGRHRYRWHRTWRWVWHLGNPPSQESILSAWYRAPDVWKQ